MLRNSLRKRGSEKKVAVVEHDVWASPKENAVTDQDVGRALNGELNGGDTERIVPTPYTVGDKEDVAVASRCDRARHEDDQPSDIQS